MAFSDPDAGGCAVATLVAESEAFPATPFALGSWEAHLPAVPATSLALKECSERPTQVDCGLLEHLCGNLVSPGKTRHQLDDGLVRGDDEDAPRPLPSSSRR
jgi:hypothetical protein